MGSRKVVRIVVGVAIVAVCNGAGMAQPVDHKAEATAKEHYRKGMRLYDLGRFDEAIHEFESAYQFQEDPFYIYNLAQAYRRAGNPGKALEFYRTYLRKAPDAADRAEVEQRIAALEAAQGPGQGTPTAPSLPPLEGNPAPVPAPTRVLPPPTAPLPEGGPMAAPDVAHGPGRMVIGGVATGVAGLAMIGTGVFFGLRAKQKQDDSRNAPVYDPGLDDSASSARTLEYVFLGVGTAALATGTVLLVLGLRDDGSGDRTVLLPGVVPHGAVLALSGSF
jgi:tetratricopeptide (TPR) repeat protein